MNPATKAESRPTRAVVRVMRTNRQRKRRLREGRENLNFGLPTKDVSCALSYSMLGMFSFLLSYVLVKQILSVWSIASKGGEGDI